jgi:Na+/H+ antiporter NhaD/arsenite permease-like protein
MLTGLAYLQLFGFYLKKTAGRAKTESASDIEHDGQMGSVVPLTAGGGGSLLSIGSAAGVALMGQARGKYTFFGHLKWAPAIAAGYIASIAIHFWINAALF